MKMITKVFLVIAILLVCLIAWALFLGEGGILENAWNGIADMVNGVWQAITGDEDGIVMPDWKEEKSVGDATDTMNEVSTPDTP